MSTDWVDIDNNPPINRIVTDMSNIDDFIIKYIMMSFKYINHSS